MSSVPKSERNENKTYKVYDNWIKLRKSILVLLLADFGFSKIKSKNSIERFKDKHPNMTPEKLREKLAKIESFQEWFIPNERETIVGLIREITWDIISANSIYPKYESEYLKRRNYHNEAIINLRRLEQELQMCIETLPVDINKYCVFAEDINSEIALIDAVKKSDKKRFQGVVDNNDIQTQSAKCFRIIKRVFKLFEDEKDLNQSEE